MKSSTKTNEKISFYENENQEVNLIKEFHNPKETDIDSILLPNSQKQMLLNGDIIDDSNFKKPKRRSRSCNYKSKKFKDKSNSKRLISDDFCIIKDSTKPKSKNNLPIECCKIPEEKISTNQNQEINLTRKLRNPKKIDINSNQLPKSKKQMLINGEIVDDFNLKNPKRRSHSCNYKSKKSKDNSKSDQNLLALWENLRRSERCPEKLIKDKKEQMILNNILNNREKGMRVIETIDKGRGVESTICFEKDSFIVEYAGDLISEKKAREKEAIYKQDPSKGSYMFYFRFKDGKYCVDATEESGKLGRLLNHSKLNPNCYVKVIPINGSPKLAIFARREIDIGEELLYDYGDRDKETLEANPWLRY